MSVLGKSAVTWQVDVDRNQEEFMKKSLLSIRDQMMARLVAEEVAKAFGAEMRQIYAERDKYAAKLAESQARQVEPTRPS